MRFRFELPKYLAEKNDSRAQRVFARIGVSDSFTSPLKLQNSGRPKRLLTVVNGHGRAFINWSSDSDFGFHCFFAKIRKRRVLNYHVLAAGTNINPSTFGATSD